MTERKPPGSLFMQEDSLHNLFLYFPSFLDGKVNNINLFMDYLINEVKLIIDDQNSSRVSSTTLVSDPSILNFHSKSFADYENISKLLAIVNNSLNLGIEMNSCVVNHYPAGQARRNPHTDTESYIDPKSPICAFSMGSVRDFHIYRKSAGNNSSEHTLFKSFRLQNNSLSVMLPPSQQHTKHQIQPGPGERWSLSFRRVIKSVHNPHEWPHTSANSNSSTPMTSLRLPTTPDTPNGPPLVHRNLFTNPIRRLSTDSLIEKQGDVLSAIQGYDMASCKLLLTALHKRIEHLEKSDITIQQHELDSLVTHIPTLPAALTQHHNISVTGPDTLIADNDNTSQYDVEDMLSRVTTEVKNMDITNNSSEGSHTNWLFEENLTPSLPFLKG